MFVEQRVRLTARPPLSKENVLVLCPFSYTFLLHPSIVETYENIASHVAMMTQVKPKMASELNDRCRSSQAVALL